MTGTGLHPRLRNDSHYLGNLPLCAVLLMHNAALPWFVLVPDVSATELCDLDDAAHATLQEETRLLARFVRSHFNVDKLNVAAIGNIVRQLHMHVVGRFVDDYCWPGVVWGTAHAARYEPAQLDDIRAALSGALGEAFRARHDG